MNPTSDRPKITLDDFRQSLPAAEPPAGLLPPLAGLWWDAKGDWKQAHESAQRGRGHRGFVRRSGLKKLRSKSHFPNPLAKLRLSF